MIIGTRLANAISPKPSMIGLRPGMLDASPITHVGKAETPILIMHGEEDTRVSPSQSYELYRSIKVRKPETPVRLVLYPGEGHGNSKAAARYDYNLRMLRWLNKYDVGSA